MHVFSLMYAAGAILFFVLDRLSKIWAFYHLQAKEIPLVSFLSLNLSLNRGVSFSLFSFQSEYGFWLLTLFVCFALLIFLLYTLYEYNPRQSILSVGKIFILTGALSNIYDRFLYEGVIDFIDFHYKGWHFPTFNMADAYIIFGISLIMVRTYNDRIYTKIS